MSCPFCLRTLRCVSNDARVTEAQRPILYVTATDHTVFLRDKSHLRSYVVEAEDGLTISEVLALVLRIAGSDLDHLEFEDPLDEKRFRQLIDPT